MKKPTVLFVNRVYPPSRGATGRILRDLARAMAKEGWDVTVVSTGNQEETVRDLQVRIIRIKAPQKPFRNIVYLWIWIKLLAGIMRAPKADLIVTMTDPPFLGVAGGIFARIKGAKHIHWCQDLYPDVLPAMGIKMPSLVMKFLRTINLGMMSKAHKTIVIGRCMAQHLIQSGLDSKKISVIPNWPDPELSRSKFQKQDVMDVMAVGNSIKGFRDHDNQLKDGPKFRLLYAGTIGRVHPIETILNAAEILNVSNPEIEFVIVGDGKRFDEMSQERSRRNLSNIRFLPFQANSRLKEVMESGDVHLISLDERAKGCVVPSKLYAALAVARPSIYIGPENTETAKVILDYKAGIVLPQGNTEKLVQAILYYRLDGQAWFAAHEGAHQAGRIFKPKDSLDAWIKRAALVLQGADHQKEKEKIVA
jgi:glycosyltransferase involved in cell wall biosynthesis